MPNELEMEDVVPFDFWAWAASGTSGAGGSASRWASTAK
jgi:hypothetical protein